MNTLLGYDNNGRVADRGDAIVRTVSPAYRPYADEIYRLYKERELANLGIVKTELEPGTGCFIHEKHVITYPYEWPADMYKDAVLFHLRLLLELDRYGLLLKDALPSNILFRSTEPVFVDFLSLIKKEHIGSEAWLANGGAYRDKRFCIAERMLLPFMIEPLMDMTAKDYRLARRRLSSGACNVAQTVAAKEPVSAAAPAKPEPLSLYRRGRRLLRAWLHRAAGRKAADKIIFAYRRDRNPDFIEYINSLRAFAKQLDVSPPASTYSTYYEEKKENYDFEAREHWGAKQRRVFGILESERPATVIDLGANTGWFSFLAERLGARVIATDIDETCANIIYKAARQHKRNILPLVMSFDDLTREFFGQPYGGPEFEGRDFAGTPLFLAPVDRLRADLTMCLGLLHHLVLGMGYGLEKVFGVLARITGRCLLVEFVGIDDAMIEGDPDFFAHLKDFNPENYRLELVLQAGSRFFGLAEVLDSHPHTRKLILFKDKKP